MTHAEVISLVATTKFVPFAECDYLAFAGTVTSENPMIGDTEDFTIILDGHVVSIIDESGREEMFDLYLMTMFSA